MDNSDLLYFGHVSISYDDIALTKVIAVTLKHIKTLFKELQRGKKYGSQMIIPVNKPLSWPNLFGRESKQ